MGSYKDARGAVPRPDDSELPEAIIRRFRDAHDWAPEPVAPLTAAEVAALHAYGREHAWGEQDALVLRLLATLAAQDAEIARLRARYALTPEQNRDG